MSYIDDLVHNCDGSKEVIYDSEIYIRNYLILSQKGYLIQDIALDFCVEVNTLYEWAASDQRFAKAMRIGRLLAISHYTTILREGDLNGGEIKMYRLILEQLQNCPVPQGIRDNSLTDQAMILLRHADKECLSTKRVAHHIEMLEKIAKIDEVSRVREMIDDVHDKIKDKIK